MNQSVEQIKTNHVIKKYVVKGQRRLKIILVILACIFLVIGIASFVYVQDYYHSEKTFAEYQLEYSITMLEKDSVITLIPDESNQKGIIFYPGGKVEYIAYIPLLAPLTELGYTCYIPKMPGNLAVFGVNKADDIMKNNEMIHEWYIGGHSLGGAMASSYAGKQNDNLAGIFLLGAYPSSDLSDTNMKLLSIVGSVDGVLNQEKYEETKKNAPTESSYTIIEGGNHGGFGNYGAQEGDGRATITNVEQQRQTVELIRIFCEE